jgi:N-formylglutamate amidohydrolase
MQIKRGRPFLRSIHEPPGGTLETPGEETYIETVFTPYHAQISDRILPQFLST